jgi:hypothetical protein
MSLGEKFPVTRAEVDNIKEQIEDLRTHLRTRLDEAETAIRGFQSGFNEIATQAAHGSAAYCQLQRQAATAVPAEQIYKVAPTDARV